MASRTPQQTLDVQMDLLRWWATDTGLSLAEGFIQSIDDAEYNNLSPAMRKTRQQIKQQGRMLCEMQKTYLAKAPTYHVTPNMVTLAQAAAEKMDPEVLRADLLPSPSGFMYFQTPVYVNDVRDQTVNVQAVTWFPAVKGEIGVRYNDRPHAGINLTLYSVFDDPNDSEHETLLKDRELLRAMGHTPPPLIMFANDPWEYGKDYDDYGAYEVYGNPPEEIRFKGFAVHRQVRAIMQSMWTLCQQKIVTMRSVTPDRRQRREIKRQGLLTEDADLRIITLRKRVEQPIEYEGDTHREINWTHQWIVDGFWRWQRYTAGVSDDHRCNHCGDVGVEHRQIYIEPYVKGPPDKPLIPKATIFKVSR